MALADRSTFVDPPNVSPRTVADLFDLLAREKAWMEQELDEICCARPALERESVDRLAALAQRLEPAVAIRERLTATDPVTLQAGVALWLSRQPEPDSTGSSE